MLFPTDDEWGLWSVDARIHRMFVLQWEELFSSETSDTWQARTVNFPALLAETIATIDVCSHHFDFRHNILHQLNEAEHLAATDPILNKYFPFAAKSIPTDKNVFASQDATSHLKRLRNQLQVALGLLSSYSSVLEAELEALLGDATSNEHKRLHALTAAYATALVARGHSSDYLAESLSLLIDPTEGTFIERFKKFTRHIQNTSSDYRFRFEIGLVDTFANVQHPDIVFTTERPIDAGNPEFSKFYRKGQENRLYADLVVNAIDPLRARSKAEQRINELFAIAHIFEPSRRGDIQGRNALLLDSSNSALEVVGLRNFWPNGLKDVSNPSKDVEKYAHLAKRLHLEDAEQIGSALQFHSLALTARSDAVRLVNLWIAIETLCRTDDRSQSIIEHIVQRVSATVATGNARKIVSNLATLMHHIRRRLAIDLSSVSSNTEFVPINDLFEVLTSRDDRLNKLLDKMSGHPLLCLHIRQIATVLADPKEIRKLLRTHKQNVEWQLRRIYRARNDVIHRGQGSTNLNRLIQHLHTYLGVTIHNLIFDLSSHSEWRLSDAFAFRSSLIHDIVAALESSTFRLVDLLEPQSIYHK